MMSRLDKNKPNLRLFWLSLIFALGLIATFITLDATGVTSGFSDGMSLALMTAATLVFVVVLHRFQDKRRLDMSDYRNLACLLAIGGAVAIAGLIVSRSSPLQHLLQLQGADFLIIMAVSLVVILVVRRA